MAADSAVISTAPSISRPTESIDKKVIKTGDLNIKVDDTESAAEEITNIAKLNGGEVLTSNFYETPHGTRTGYLTVRVPNNNFEKTFAEMKKVATELVSENTNSQDITAEYIDLEARLKNKRAEEISFLDLLKRSGKVEEILSVTREVARVRGEIEQMEGQLRYLNSQTDKSTITVNLSEDEEISPVTENWRPWQIVKASVTQLITNSQNFLNSLIRFLIIILPALIVYGLLIMLIAYVARKIYNRVNK
jgi:hypothetical protein